MKYIQLKNTDLNISPICLGTAGFGDKSDHGKSFEDSERICTRRRKFY